MEAEQSLELGEMEEALDTLYNFSKSHADIEHQTIPKGIQFVAYQKGFLWSRKPVATIKVELIEDFKLPIHSPKLDTKYLKFTTKDALRSTESISNYGLLKNYAAQQEIDVREEIASDEFKNEYSGDITTFADLALMMLAAAKKYQEVFDWLEVFEDKEAK